ncbi:MAG: hypothetical protein US11_C0002G0005 [Candidatus Roizmanbacteria bacterium GW2011_GWA2_36_23]|uniref:GTPase HflX n=1 Tax=Candidatus Roizmanbacteria bacterium GW2011_GWA2_36_23 TaxID=1618480 RepID=A0A0G0HDD0_9BACT|nr:MAG: hypothetical protein US11_C0002G0005 [Candidatus Roizmanbacteria bacterium GW2011_GWA2_36_23]
MTQNQFNSLAIKVIGPHDHSSDELQKFREIESLVSVLGGKIIVKQIQHRLFPDESTYIGKGKIEEIKDLIRYSHIRVIILNDIVNPAQIFRLEKSLWSTDPNIKVWDRADVILEIFDKRAHSSEAKLQIELARMKHLGPRIYGLGGGLLSRQGGGIGMRGLGETNIEIMKRQIKDKLRLTEEKLKKIIHSRQEKMLYRKKGGYKTIALVGYTNAGKTTLFNNLTGKTKKVENAVFTTLDSYVGKLNHQTNKPILISDTIGFIQDLPPSLIQAFKSTLLETLTADLIYHVIDSSDSEIERKIEMVNEILAEFNIESNKVVYIFNKIDTISDSKRQLLNRLYPGKSLFVSSASGEGINSMLSSIHTIFP